METPMKKLLLFLSLASSLWAAETAKEAPPPAPLEPALMAASLWETPAPQWLETNRRLGFRWLSNTKDAAQSTLKGALFLGMPVYQSVIRFEGEKASEIELQLYNRGDAGDLPRPDYEALIKKAVGAISAATQARFVPRGKDGSNAVRADGVIWTTPQAVYLLEYSFTKTQEIPFRAEFVRLRITPAPKPKGLVAASFEASRKPVFLGTSHITRDLASGDVVIKDVPMVDQGEKGYCVVAASERLLRYYGIKADANELAQLANSSAEKGTSLQAIAETLKKLAARLKIHTRTLYEIKFEALITDYQLAAKRAKEAGINPDVKNISELYGQMKPDVLRAARTKKKSELDGFKRDVKTSIGNGVPLLWSVILGVVPDGSKAKTPGGHTRLIIGYNEKTDELLFSDSWGPGHELKRMPTLDAWAITTHLDSVEPF